MMMSLIMTSIVYKSMLANAKDFTILLKVKSNIVNFERFEENQTVSLFCVTVL